MSASSSRPHTSTLYPVHTVVYRGYDTAVRATEKKEMARSRSRSSSLPSSIFRGVPSQVKEGDRIGVSAEQEDVDVKKRDSDEFRGRKPEVRHSHSPSIEGGWSDDRDGDITDLILIIHGIGQGVRNMHCSLFSAPN